MSTRNVQPRSWSTILSGRENIVNQSGKQGNTDFWLFARVWQNFAHTRTRGVRLRDAGLCAKRC